MSAVKPGRHRFFDECRRSGRALPRLARRRESLL